MRLLTSTQLYRTVGIIVLLLLLLIFLPPFFRDKPPVETKSNGTELILSHERIKEIEPENEVKVKKNKHYVIKLTQSNDIKKIDSYIAILRLNNFTIYSEPIKESADNEIILYSGPYSTEESASRAQSEILMLVDLIGTVIEVDE